MHQQQGRALIAVLLGMDWEKEARPGIHGGIRASRSVGWGKGMRAG
jgi:hypothetical protein